ncbi:MAG TPA: acyltransferase [Ktedonobacterales bacterium]
MRTSGISESLLRRNSIDFLRLFFAALVIVSHAYPLTGRGDDPLEFVSHNGESLGGLAVAGFFALSGLLITRSYLTTGAPLPFLWHRILRIFPAFWVCLLATVLLFGPLAAILEGVSLGSYVTAHGGPLGYLVHNATLQMRQYELSGLLAHLPYPSVFDGSLWTLANEFGCYLVVGLLGASGLLTRARWLLPLLGLALLGVLAVPAVLALPGVRSVYADVSGGNIQLVRQWTYFFLGASAYLYRKQFPLMWPVALAALLAYGTAARFSGASPLAVAVSVPLLTYIVLYVAFRLPIFGAARFGDISYGVYIYAFPVQQLVVLLLGAALALWADLALVLAITVLLALLSCHGIERPCLRLKHALPRLKPLDGAGVWADAVARWALGTTRGADVPQPWSPATWRAAEGAAVAGPHPVSPRDTSR